MKNKLFLSLFGFATISVASANLYYVPNDIENSIPLTWSVGIDAIYDDNVTPGSINDGDAAISLNPYVGLSFLNLSPQSTLEVYGRLGATYFIEELESNTAEDVYTQIRAGLNYTHRFNERLRFVSRNILARELEPDYTMGVATGRQAGEYINWQTDNSIGYRWTERLATYTGFQLGGLNYSDSDNSDRFTTTLYQQFRYQLNPQTVLTASYRHSEESASGLGADASNDYFLVGLEYRYSPTTILILNTGTQLRSVDGINGVDTTVPFLELTARSQLTEEFNLGTFIRYGSDPYDTVVVVGNNLVRYDDRQTLRLGISADYNVNPSLTLNSGVNVISTSFAEGIQLAPPNVTAPDSDEFLYNLYVGASLKITDNIFGTASYNFTDSSSDADGRDYDRNRFSVGVRADF